MIHYSVEQIEFLRPDKNMFNKINRPIKIFLYKIDLFGTARIITQL